MNRWVGIDVVSQAGTRSLIDVVIPVDGSSARIARDVVLILLFTLLIKIGRAHV